MTVQEEDTEMQRPRVGVVPGINEQTTVTTEAGVQWLERAVGSRALSKGWRGLSGHMLFLKDCAFCFRGGGAFACLQRGLMGLDLFLAG